jgi:hypothetical protein
VPDDQACLPGRYRRHVVDERCDGRLAAGVEMCGEGDVPAGRHLRLGREQRRARVVRGVGGEDRDLARARGKLDRAGALARCEVVESTRAVDEHVDRGVRDAVHDVDGSGVLGGGHGGGRERGSRGGERAAESQGQTAHERPPDLW